MSHTPDIQSQSHRIRIDFLRTELATCFSFASIAETERKTGDHANANRSVADAEKGYATMRRFLSDSKHAKHISEEERQELMAGMERLRATLDKLAGRQK